MSAKMTTMVLNTVDLQCSSCYKKVKKVLCKFPAIRDQVYDVKNNKVTIKVLCCDPEKIRDKICCKGRKVIKSIEIVDDTPKTKEPEKKEPEKSKAPDKPKEAAPKEVAKPKEQEPTKAPEKSKEEKPKAKPPAEKTPEKPKPPAEKPAEKAPEPVPVCGPVHGFPPMPMYPGGACCGSCAQGYVGGPCYQGHGRPVPPPPGPPMPMYPGGACCGSCAQGYGGGPCYQGYGRPVPPPPGPCYDYGRPVPPPPGPCYDYGYGYRGSKCCVKTDYFSEENPQGCTIM